MPLKLNVHFLPDLITSDALAGETVVVIDVLRASTTICHALASGAIAVLPFGEVDKALQRATELRTDAPDAVLLGGERGGLVIDGFDLGNSPTEYTQEKVDGKTVVFTTTNGTQAMAICDQAKEVFIGTFANLEAVCRLLIEKSRSDDNAPVHLLCAGTDGEVTREDVLAAGAIAYRLSKSLEPKPQENDTAQLARAAWRAVYAAAIARGVELTGYLAEELRDTQGGHNLMVIGHGADVNEAAKIDQFSFVPRFDLQAGRIELP